MAASVAFLSRLGQEIASPVFSIIKNFAPEEFLNMTLINKNVKIILLNWELFYLSVPVLLISKSIEKWMIEGQK